MNRSWIGLAFDIALLGMESQRVVGLRVLKIAGGGCLWNADDYLFRT
jgi:hypothetical protein